MKTETKNLSPNIRCYVGLSGPVGSLALSMASIENASRRKFERRHQRWTAQALGCARGEESSHSCRSYSELAHAKIDENPSFRCSNNIRSRRPKGNTNSPQSKRKGRCVPKKKKSILKHSDQCIEQKRINKRTNQKNKNYIHYSSRSPPDYGRPVHGGVPSGARLCAVVGCSFGLLSFRCVCVELPSLPYGGSAGRKTMVVHLTHSTLQLTGTDVMSILRCSPCLGRQQHTIYIYICDTACIKSQVEPTASASRPAEPHKDKCILYILCIYCWVCVCVCWCGVCCNIYVILMRSVDDDGREAAARHAMIADFRSTE